MDSSRDRSDLMDRREFVVRSGPRALLASTVGSHLLLGRPRRGAAAVREPARDVEAPQSLSLFVAGDVMTGRGIDQILPHSVDPVLYEPWVKDARAYVQIAEEAGGDIPSEASYEYVWGDALSELEARAPELSMVNLETSVTTHHEPWPGKGIQYRMHPGNAPVLTVAGLDAVILANNHVLDWSRPGLAETLGTLEAAGLRTPGAGLDADAAGAPAVFPIPGGRLLVFAYGSLTAGVPPAWAAGLERSGVSLLSRLGAGAAERVARDVEAHRREGDRVVLSLHWGSNWGYAVPVEQQTFARRVIDLGVADMVFGHSSHHPKGMEIYRGRLILYGAGDFLNDYEGIGGRPEYRGELTLMYFPRLAPDGTLEALEMVPMRIRHFRLRRASSEERAWLATRLDRESRTFGASVAAGPEGVLRLAW